jgi:hypothetical protein
MFFANSTARQTDVSEQKIALSTSVEPEVARGMKGGCNINIVVYNQSGAIVR